jgi:predicted GNAT superfamily acetyltransferase
VNRSCWQLTTFFILFHSKFEMSSYMKVVSLKNWTTFILVDFVVLAEIWRTRQKFRREFTDIGFLSRV